MSIKISRILHAGYIFECDQTQIAFDPIFENPFSINCFAFPNVKFDKQKIKNLKFDAVFISHFHDDHCSFESLNLLDRSIPLFVFCIFEELFSLLTELGFLNVHSLKLNQPIQIGSLKVTPKRALDEDVDSIFHINAHGFNILNVVDSWIDDTTLAELSKDQWDLVLWPFQTMREVEVLSPLRASKAAKHLPPEWIDQLKLLNPKYIVPSSCQFVHESWSWYNQALFPISYSQFEREVGLALPDSKVVRLNPSTSVVITQNLLEVSKPLSWVNPIGNQDVDYLYDELAEAPSTSEISKHFPELRPEQSAKVFDYCSNGLIKKLRSLGASSDIYFAKARLWCLKIYDHRGEMTQFMYDLAGSHIELAQENSRTISWLTEISIYKFYAALELGEALTSLYIRINDRVFTPEIEKEIATADLIEDPLVRCLFNTNFGAYQIAQLKKIQTSRD